MAKKSWVFSPKRRESLKKARETWYKAGKIGMEILNKRKSK